MPRQPKQVPPCGPFLRPCTPEPCLPLPRSSVREPNRCRQSECCDVPSSLLNDSPVPSLPAPIPTRSFRRRAPEARTAAACSPQLCVAVLPQYISSPFPLASSLLPLPSLHPFPLKIRSPRRDECPITSLDHGRSPFLKATVLGGPHRQLAATTSAAVLGTAARLPEAPAIASGLPSSVQAAPPAVAPAAPSCSSPWIRNGAPPAPALRRRATDLSSRPSCTTYPTARTTTRIRTIPSALSVMAITTSPHRRLAEVGPVVKTPPCALSVRRTLGGTSSE